MSLASQHYHIPKEPGLGPALALAILVHAVLFAFLWIGIRWVNEVPATVEAEVWDTTVRDAAPQVAPTPVPDTPPPVAVKSDPTPAKDDDVDIALELEKKRKEKLKLEQDQQVADQKRLEQEKKDAELLKRKQELADAKLREKVMEEDRKRMLNLPGAQSTPGKGDAARKTGPIGDATWAGLIRAKIKSKMGFPVPADLSGDPFVEIQVTVFPDGGVANTIISKASGLPGFDAAVVAAINAAAPLPKDKTGNIPRSFPITYHAKD